MPLWFAAVLLLSALAGIFLSRRYLHKGTPVRMLSIIGCALLITACAVYIILTLMLVTAIQ